MKRKNKLSSFYLRPYPESPSCQRHSDTEAELPGKNLKIFSKRGCPGGRGVRDLLAKCISEKFSYIYFSSKRLARRYRDYAFMSYAHTPNRTGMPRRAWCSRPLRYHYAIWAFPKLGRLHQESPSLQRSSDTEPKVPKENLEIFFKPKGPLPNLGYASTRNRTWIPRGVWCSRPVRYHYAIEAYV